MQIHTHTLPNGIRCIHRRVKSPVAHCALMINTGSRDELPREHGIAHLTEHALFKGTAHRRAYQINCRLEKLGGELNAFTSKEETVIHATTLQGDVAKAAELIADLAFHSTFPPREVEREKEVILDEINSYKDSPAERIYDDFEELLFAGSPLAHNTLGRKASVMGFSQQDILDFVGRTYNTDQMVFAAIGNFSEKKFHHITARYLGGVDANPRQFSRKHPEACLPFQKTLRRNSYQAHCLIGGRAFDLHNPRRITLALLTNLLGGPSANSLLNVSLREKNGLSYNVEAGYTPLNDTGIATIYFSADKEKVERCLEIIERQLSAICRGEVTPRQLSMAKRQYMGQLAIAMESNENHILGAAKSFLIYNRVDGIEAMQRKIAEVTREGICEVAEEIFAGMSRLLYM